jgi:RNA polymerase sigma-70 factor (ECF subfamily)
MTHIGQYAFDILTDMRTQERRQCDEELSSGDLKDSNETDLIHGAQAGSIAAYNELVLRYQSYVYNIAYHMLGDAELAADAVQETFISVYRALRRFKCGSFRAWITRIVKNTCYDEFRQRRYRLLVSLDALNHRDVLPLDHLGCNQSESPEAYVERTELQRRLLQGLQDLPPDQRLMIVLSDIEDYSYNEISEIVGVPVGTVKSRLSRGRQKMRSNLQAADWLTTTLPEPKTACRTELTWPEVSS